MSYFTNFQDTLFSTAELSKGEKEKIDNFLQLLEDSGVGKIICKETKLYTFYLLNFLSGNLIAHIVVLVVAVSFTLDKLYVVLFHL